MKKILIIDDDQDLLKLMEYVFDNEGYKTLTTTDAQKGIEIAKLIKPDLILLDIVMPKMYGTQTASIIGDDPELCDIPIIFISGLGSDENSQLGINQMMIAGKNYSMISKPFNKNDLIKKVKKILR